MKLVNLSSLIQFTARPKWYTTLGWVMIFVGGGLAISSIISPDVYMLGKSASWIPVIGGIVLLVGIMRCLDGLASETALGKLYNIQGGLLDIVVGFLVALSTNDEVNYLNLLIVGYLLTQGLYRNVLLFIAKIHNPLPNQITGLVSIALGIMIWIDWPASLWFIAFSLSVDIIFRGWVLTVLASSLRKEPTTEKLEN